MCKSLYNTNPLSLTILSTRNYVAAAYASIFGDTLIEKLEKRTLSISELRPTSHDIQKALTTKFGVPPAQCTVTIEKVSVQVDEMIKKGEPGALLGILVRTAAMVISSNS